ncbi:hypothetical protein LXL04_015078 [Taraxacum kok-saghyz]
MARALESTLKYWLKSFSRDQFNGDALHASLGLPPAISVTMAKVGKLEIMCKLKLLYLSNVQLEQIVVIIDKPESPCHLYSDLEFNIKENAEKNGDEMVDLLILIAFEALFDKLTEQDYEAKLTDVNPCTHLESLHALSFLPYIIDQLPNSHRKTTTNLIALLIVKDRMIKTKKKS